MITFSDVELQKLVEMIRKKDALATLLANYDHTKGDLPTILNQTIKKAITDEPVEKFISSKKVGSPDEIRNLKLEYFKALRDQRLGNTPEEKVPTSEGEATDVSAE